VVEVGVVLGLVFGEVANGGGGRAVIENVSIYQKLK
jgi:hypothetical protein